MGQSLAVARATPECYEQTFQVGGSCCGCTGVVNVKVTLISAVLRGQEHHQALVLDWLIDSSDAKWKIRTFRIDIKQKCLFEHQLVEETVHMLNIPVAKIKDPVTIALPVDFCPALSCSLCSLWTELEATINDGQIFFKTRLKLLPLQE